MRSAEAALADLEKGTGPASVARVTLIFGEETYYQVRLLRAIRRMVVDPAFEVFNYTYLEYEGATFSAARSAILTLPMLSAARLVVARDPAELAPSRAGRKRGGDEAEAEGEDGDSGEGVAPPAAPEAAAGAPGAAAALSPSEAAQGWADLFGVVPAESRLVVALGWELRETSPLLKAADRLDPPADVIQCLKATQRSAEPWVRKMAAELGGTIDPAAAQALVLRSGSSLAVLESEVRKLLAYAEPGPGRLPHITAGDVQEAATPSAEASVFELVDYIGNRRPYPAIQKLRRLVEQGEAPLGLMAMVVRQVRLVLLTHELLAAGAPLRDIEKRLGLPTFVVRNYLGQAQKLDRPQLVRMLRALGRMDLDVKTGRQDPVQALELFILQQCA